MGPLALPGDGTGTLSSEDRADILDRTGVSAAVRYRKSYGFRALTLSGPAEGLTEARRLATQYILQSQEAQEEHREEEPPAASSDLAEKVRALEQANETTQQHLQTLAGQVGWLLQRVPVAPVHMPVHYYVPAAAPETHRRHSRHRRRSSSSHRSRSARKPSSASDSPAPSRVPPGLREEPAERGRSKEREEKPPLPEEVAAKRSADKDSNSDSGSSRRSPTSPADAPASAAAAAPAPAAAAPDSLPLQECKKELAEEVLDSTGPPVHTVQTKHEEEEKLQEPEAETPAETPAPEAPALAPTVPVSAEAGTLLEPETPILAAAEAETQQTKGEDPPAKRARDAATDGEANPP